MHWNVLIYWFNILSSLFTVILLFFVTGICLTYLFDEYVLIDRNKLKNCVYRPFQRHERNFLKLWHRIYKYFICLKYSCYIFYAQHLVDKPCRVTVKYALVYNYTLKKHIFIYQNLVALIRNCIWSYKRNFSIQSIDGIIYKQPQLHRTEVSRSKIRTD